MFKADIPLFDSYITTEKYIKHEIIPYLFLYHIFLA